MIVSARVPSMRRPIEKAPSPRRRHAADALRRARRLPVGPDRNDLRQLAIGLLRLEGQGLEATMQEREAALRTFAH